MILVPDQLQTGVRPPSDAFLTPGTLFCSSKAAIVTTVLGSCVAVCLIDTGKRAAGINHFVLPYSPAGEDGLRYGDIALDRLLERMVRFGCDTRSLRAKVFGGAAVLPFGEAKDTVGTKNVGVAIDWLKHHAIPVTARRTGGKNGLLIRFNTGSGSVMVRKIASGEAVGMSGSIASYDSLLSRPG